MQRKYLIDSILNQFDLMTQRMIIQDLCIKTDLAERTFNRKRKAPIDSNETLDSDQLTNICKYFDQKFNMKLTISDLVAKPIKETA